MCLTVRSRQSVGDAICALEKKKEELQKQARAMEQEVRRRARDLDGREEVTSTPCVCPVIKLLLGMCLGGNVAIATSQEAGRRGEYVFISSRKP